MKQELPNSWISLRDELKRRIVEREWLPGEQVPNESELAEEFGCARATVNRAMQALADSGLLERRRKAGTRVALNPVRKAQFDIPIIRTEGESRGVTWHQELLERRISKTSAQLARQYRLSPDTRLLFLRSIHFSGQNPFVYETRWISLKAVPDAESVDFSVISANEWLVRNAPFTHGDIQFLAANMSDLEAQCLKTQPGDAAFVLERTTWIDDDAITAARLVYPPGYRMQSSL